MLSNKKKQKNTFFSACIEQIIKKNTMLEICNSTSENFLLNQRHVLAVPSSLQALRAGRELYGTKDARLIPILLTLSRACLGTKYILLIQFPT